MVISSLIHFFRGLLFVPYLLENKSIFNCFIFHYSKNAEEFLRNTRNGYIYSFNNNNYKIADQIKYVINHSYITNIVVGNKCVLCFFL